MLLSVDLELYHRRELLAAFAAVGVEQRLVQLDGLTSYNKARLNRPKYFVETNSGCTMVHAMGVRKSGLEECLFP